MQFHTEGGAVFTRGSNANITVSETIRMENPEGSCVITLPNHATRLPSGEVGAKALSVYPTLNGVAMLLHNVQFSSPSGGKICPQVRLIKNI